MVSCDWAGIFGYCAKQEESWLHLWGDYKVQRYTIKLMLDDVSLQLSFVFIFDLVLTERMEAGDWLIQKENKKIKGQLDIPEFSFGELEDLQVHAMTLFELWFGNHVF